MNNIKKIRSESNITIRRLVDTTGLSIGYISMLENDTSNRLNPTREVMEKISKALNKTVPEVFFSEDISKSKEIESGQIVHP